MERRVDVQDPQPAHGARRALGVRDHLLVDDSHVPLNADSVHNFPRSRAAERILIASSPQP